MKLDTSRVLNRTQLAPYAKMTSVEEFRQNGKELVDFIANYYISIRDRPVAPNVEPGFLRPLLGEEAPEGPEKWAQVYKDIENIIMPGMLHWQSPQFHGYFPTGFR